jgi:hypothetical protein
VNGFLRYHWRTAAAVAIAAAVGLTASLAVLRWAPALEVPAVRDTDWGIAWSRAAYGPAVARGYALSQLIRLAQLAALGTLAVTAVSVAATALAGAWRRRTDVVVRRAVGASRRALAAACLGEAAVVAGGAIVVGMTAGGLAGRALAGAWPGGYGAASLATPALAVVAVAGTILLTGLLPLGHARRRTPGVDAAPGLVPPVVPAAQLGLALIVLVAAAQLARRAAPDAGPPSPAATGELMAVSLGEPHALARSARLRALLERLRRDPAVTVVGLASPGALVGLGTVDLATTDCGRCAQGGIAVPLKPVWAVHHLVTADTFRAIGLRVVAGRAIADTDDGDEPRVAVVSRSLAEGFFESAGAVGRRIRVGGPNDWYAVVGVADGPPAPGIGTGAQPPRAVYLSALQHDARSLDLLLDARSGEGGAAVLARAGGDSLGLASSSPVGAVSVQAVEREATRWFARAIGLAGWAALGVGVVGLAAVMWLWSVAALLELAVRRVVGARRRHVVGRVVTRACAITGAGLLLAWWLGPLAQDALEHVVRGVPPWDLGLAAGPAGVLFGAALAAALVPLWRAIRGTPAVTLGLAQR